MAHLLVVTLLPGLTIPLGRSLFVRGAATAAVAAALPPVFAEDKFVAKRATDVSQIVGSGGLSSYNDLKLSNALKELAEVPVPAEIKPSVDVISDALPLILQNKAPDGAKISAATDALAKLVLTDELQTQVAMLGKQSAGIRAGISKSDANAAAVAAAGLADALTDFCYAYEGASKPLAELRKGQPAIYDRDRTAIELPVSGKSL